MEFGIIIALSLTVLILLFSLFRQRYDVIRLKRLEPGGRKASEKGERGCPQRQQSCSRDNKASDSTEQRETTQRKA